MSNLFFEKNSTVQLEIIRILDKLSSNCIIIDLEFVSCTKVWK